MNIPGLFRDENTVIQDLMELENEHLEILPEPDFYLIEVLNLDIPIIAFEGDPILAAYEDPLERDWIEAFFERMTGCRDIATIILTNAAEFDIPPSLAFSLSWEESRYNPRAVNRANTNRTIDRGLFQLNSASFPDLKEQDFFDPRINAWYGLSHLRWCLDMAGTEVAGLAMYNAGLNRVRTDGTPKITLDYISRIINRQRRIDEIFLEEYMKMRPIIDYYTDLESMIVEVSETAAPEFSFNLPSLGRR